MSLSRRQIAALIAGALVWTAVVGRGVHELMVYAYTPAATAAVGEAWPVTAPVTGPMSQPLLGVFVHAECPCSRASLNELSRVMAQARGRVEARVYIESTGPDGGLDSDNARTAARIPGVQVVADRDGLVAESLRAAVSGETLLFAAGGSMLFHGGLTAARGHEGDNDGRRAVLSLLEGGSAPPTVPVFGCYFRELRS